MYAGLQTGSVGDFDVKSLSAPVALGGLAGFTAMMFLPKRLRGQKRMQYAVGVGIAAAFLVWKFPLR